jgi:hypothetical protein
MRADGFDKVNCPFNYRRELGRARRALDAKVAKYISKNRKKSYRDLAQEFGLSMGTLSRIARDYDHKRKPGPRPGQARRTIASKSVPVAAIEGTHTE